MEGRAVIKREHSRSLSQAQNRGPLCIHSKPYTNAQGPSILGDSGEGPYTRQFHDGPGNLGWKRLVVGCCWDWNSGKRAWYQGGFAKWVLFWRKEIGFWRKKWKEKVGWQGLSLEIHFFFLSISQQDRQIDKSSLSLFGLLPGQWAAVFKFEPSRLESVTGQKKKRD